MKKQEKNSWSLFTSRKGKLSSKGQMQKVVDMVLYLASRLVILLVVYGLWLYMSGWWDIEICRFTVLMADALSIAGKSVTGIHCPINNLTVQSEDVVQGNVLEENELKRTIAEEMKFCWYKMGEGQSEPFSKDMFGGRGVCVVCSRISFDEEIIEDTGTARISGFERYVNETTMEEVGNFESQTYADYFSKEENGVSYLLYGIPIATDVSSAGTLETSDSMNLEEDYDLVYKIAEGGAYEDIPFVGGTAQWIYDQGSLSAMFLVEKDDLYNLRCNNVFQ